MGDFFRDFAEEGASFGGGGADGRLQRATSHPPLILAGAPRSGRRHRLEDGEAEAMRATTLFFLISTTFVGCQPPAPPKVAHESKPVTLISGWQDEAGVKLRATYFTLLNRCPREMEWKVTSLTAIGWS